MVYKYVAVCSLSLVEIKTLYDKVASSAYISQWQACVWNEISILGAVCICIPKYKKKLQ